MPLLELLSPPSQQRPALRVVDANVNRIHNTTSNNKDHVDLRRRSDGNKEYNYNDSGGVGVVTKEVNVTTAARDETTAEEYSLLVLPAANHDNVDEGLVVLESPASTEFVVAVKDVVDDDSGQTMAEEEDDEDQFRLVCLHRCSEEIEDEVQEGDILQPWSMDDFDVLHKLGSGAVGTVYQAQERQSNYGVALKVQKAEEEALCEMDIHIDLEHFGIVKMIDYFYTSDSDACENLEDGGNDTDDDDARTLYIVFILELCQESLFDSIRNQPERFIPEEQAASLFHNIFDAFEYLHAQGIIHCDVKSLNFLLTQAKDGDGDYYFNAAPQQQLKLADFGMAVRNDEREVVGGSCIYMSPEHLMAWRQCSDEFDHRSDIYSLGVVLYEALVGYIPYQVVQNDQDYEDLLEDGLAGEPILDLRRLDDCTAEEPIYVPPPIFPEFITDEARDLIERLMAARPEDRITMEEAKHHAWFRIFQKRQQ